MPVCEKVRRMRKLGGYLFIAGFCAFTLFAQQTAPVTVKVEIVNPKAGNKPTAAGAVADSSNVAVWLKPVGGGSGSSIATPATRPLSQIAQNHKSFHPHVLVVQVDTAVQFPNEDPFLHNVFSLFEGKRFDLGFYEAGSSKTVHFDRVGVSFLFCNIHSEMSGAVITVDTPYFGLSDHSGRVSIPNVPNGRYQLSAWDERSLPDDLKSVSRMVTISETARALEPIRIVENPNFTFEHKNKYGQDYVPPANTNPTYSRP